MHPTTIPTHMPRNDAAAPGQVCPDIRIHAIDIVQPPGIAISPMADMDPHQKIVPPALAANSSAATARKRRLGPSLTRHAPWSLLFGSWATTLTAVPSA